MMAVLSDKVAQASALDCRSLFYEISKERHSVRAASRFILKLMRVDSDLCELK